MVKVKPCGNLVSLFFTQLQYGLKFLKEFLECLSKTSVFVVEPSYKQLYTLQALREEVKMNVLVGDFLMFVK